MKYSWNWSITILLALLCGGLASAASPTEEEMFLQFEVPKRKKTRLAQVWMDLTPDVILKHMDLSARRTLPSSTNGLRRRFRSYRLSPLVA